MTFSLTATPKRLVSSVLITQALAACSATPTAVAASSFPAPLSAAHAVTQHLTTPEGRIAYDDTGTGPVVICVPSLGDLRAEYRFLRPILLDAGYRVVTMDVRGMGESSTDWPDYSVAGVGADVVALARHLDAGPVAVIGDSMAAGAAVWAAAEAPELVERLVLIGPFVRSPDPAWVRRAIASLFGGFWGAGLWIKYYRTLYPTARPADFEDYLAKLRANLDDGARLASVREMLAASKDASEERLPRVKVPAIVLMGTKDPDFPDPAAEGRFVAERLHAKLHMIEGAGHYPHAEMPAVAGPLITEFLRQVQHGS